MKKKEQMQNPFVGLRPFEREDSLYYFGRNEQTKELLRQLHETRFLAVVGGSGSGKSSLIRAGLIPNLEAGFLVQDRDLWQIATMKPGDTPQYNLAKAVLTALGESEVVERVEAFSESILRKGAQAVLEKVQPALDASDANLLLLVDQFEELFRFRQDKATPASREEAANFVGIMLRLAEQTTAPIYVCMTMRSDFLGDCDAFHGLPEAMNRSQYLVPRLTRKQRSEAIAGPIRLSCASIAPRLLDRLLNESVDMRDGLPVLQHALMRTWAEWAKDGEGTIDIQQYEEICTIEQSLSRHADEALDELSEEDQLITKRLFQTLTEIDAGNRHIRRPAHLNEIVAISGTTLEKVMTVINKFREDDRNFLVLSSEKPADDPLVDISHESFIRQWQKLSDWVDGEAESAKIYRRLAETAELHGRNRADLYRGVDLQVALEWREDRQPTADWGKRHHEGFDEAIKFLDKSHTARDAEVLKNERQQEELKRLLRIERRELYKKRISSTTFNIGEKTDNLLMFPQHHAKHDEQLKYFHEIADFDRSVFIMTKYPDEEAEIEKNAELKNVIQIIKDTIKECGYYPRIASDDRYHLHLWDNVELYLLGCSKGVAILEDRYNSELNPNVAMEWGWMRALGKDVLFLIEKKINHQRSDWSGLIESSFDWDYPENGIKTAVKKWLTKRINKRKKKSTRE